MPDRNQVHQRADMVRRMREATRLTNAGRLHEATALIQQTLSGRHGAPAPAPAEPPSAPGRSKVHSTVVRTERTTTTPPDTTAIGPGDLAVPATRSDAGVGRRVTGRFLQASLTNSAGTRSYKVHVPGTVGVAPPLLVMLHGCTQDAEDLAAGTRMNLVAGEHGFVVVYPEQAANANPSRCWNWFSRQHQQRGRGEPSIIADITREVAGSYDIDPRRIYVAGMSAGAAMAVVMGTTHPDLFAAVGAHSGLAYGVATDLPSALTAMKQSAPAPAHGHASVPTIVFHGDRDRTVDQRNAEHVLRQATADVAGALLTVHQGGADGGRRYTRYVYRDARGRCVAEGWSVHGMGHAWSGGDPGGSYTDAGGPDASAEMVRFFLDHPLTV